MWDSLWIACGLVLVIEGLMPSLNPKGFKRTMNNIIQLDDRVLRTFGLFSMSIGATVVYLLSH